MLDVLGVTPRFDGPVNSAFVDVLDRNSGKRIRVEIYGAQNYAGNRVPKVQILVSNGSAETALLLASIKVPASAGAVTLPEPKTIRVGVVFNRKFDTPQEAAQCAQAGFEKVFHYKALESLKLTIGDKVRAPIGTPNDPITRDHCDGVVVTFTPKPTGFFIRTIEERA